MLLLEMLNQLETTNGWISKDLGWIWVCYIQDGLLEPHTHTHTHTKHGMIIYRDIFFKDSKHVYWISVKVRAGK